MLCSWLGKHGTVSQGTWAPGRPEGQETDSPLEPPEGTRWCGLTPESTADPQRCSKLQVCGNLLEHRQAAGILVSLTLLPLKNTFFLSASVSPACHMFLPRHPRAFKGL